MKSKVEKQKVNRQGNANLKGRQDSFQRRHGVVVEAFPDRKECRVPIILPAHFARQSGHRSGHNLILRRSLFPNQTLPQIWNQSDQKVFVQNEAQVFGSDQLSGRRRLRRDELRQGRRLN